MKPFLPIAFTEKMKELLDSEYPHFIQSYQQNAMKGIRINHLKLTSEQFLKLTPFSLTPIPWVPHEGYYYQEPDRPGKHPYHAAGLYYIQEPSAMAVVDVLDPKPDEIILDLAAAPGGKATQCAVRMQNRGLLIANEIHPARAKALSENVERLGITNTIVTNEEPDRLATRFPAFFDRIILDAPCSGEGMFRKDEVARNEWSPELVSRCAARQIDILIQAAIMLKPGGRLVYSTCTFSPEENEQVMDHFLNQHPDWELIPITKENGLSNGEPAWSNSQNPQLKKTARLWPHLLQGEGHFIALLQKKGEIDGKEHVDMKKNSLSKRNSSVLEALTQFKRFARETLYKSFEFLPDQWTLFGSQLYQLPDRSPHLDKLKILRAGLHVGEVKKDRFEPSHALSLALHKEDFIQSINYTSDLNEIQAYLHGDALFDHSNRKGWACLLVDGFPLGWVKASNGQLKNHYPKGLRTP